MKRALEAAEVFAHFCAATGLPRRSIKAVATSAIRDASNQQVFLDRVRDETGLEVRVLSREEEAYYGYLAAVNSTTLADGAVLDLGGGSLQLVEVLSRHPGRLGSWPLGAVRMTEHFLSEDDPPTKKARKAMRAHVRETLEQEADWLPRTGRQLVGIGGTMRNLAAAIQAEAGRPSLGGIQGFEITPDALDDLVERLAAMPADERGDVKGIKYARADLILAGAMVVQVVLEHGGFEAITVTEAGLREGVFFSEHLDGDPPLFDDVRRRERREPRRALPRRPQAHRARRDPRAHPLRRARRARAAPRRPLGARAALLGLRAARHRHVRRLRRPPQALEVSHSQRRSAGLRSTRGRARRAGRALSPQGHAGLRRALPARRGRRRRRASTASRSSCGSPRTSSAAATRASARRTSPPTTARSASSSRPTAARVGRALGGAARGRALRTRLRARPEGRGAVDEPHPGQRPARRQAGASRTTRSSRPRTGSSSSPTRGACGRSSATPSCSTRAARTCCTRPASGRSPTCRWRTSTRRCSSDRHDVALPVQGRRVLLVAARRRRPARGRPLGLRGAARAAPWLRGFAALYPGKVDRWLVEDEPVAGGLRDPYHRVDVHTSSRPVRVTAAGEVIAQSTHPTLVFETSMPVRAYLPRGDVKAGHLRPSDTTSTDPYMGDAIYWHVHAGGETAARRRAQLRAAARGGDEDRRAGLLRGRGHRGRARRLTPARAGRRSAG